MLGRLEAVSFLEVSVLEEEPAHFWSKKQHGAEEKQEYGNALHVMYRIVWMELNAVERHAIWPLVLLDLNAIRVVGTHLV